MQLTRDQFIEHFWPGLQVQCLRMWPRHRRDAPVELARCFYDQLKVSGGTTDRSLAAFRPLAEPVIEELHRTTPKGERPDAKALAGVLYDALKAAGANVEIVPSQEPASSSGV